MRWTLLLVVAIVGASLTPMAEASPPCHPETPCDPPPPRRCPPLPDPAEKPVGFAKALLVCLLP